MSTFLTSKNSNKQSEGTTMEQNVWNSVDIEPLTTETGEDDWVYQTSGKLLVYSPLYGIVTGVYEYSLNFNYWRLDDELEHYEIEGATHWMNLPDIPKE